MLHNFTLNPCSTSTINVYFFWYSPSHLSICRTLYYEYIGYRVYLGAEYSKNRNHWIIQRKVIQRFKYTNLQQQPSVTICTDWYSYISSFCLWQVWKWFEFPVRQLPAGIGTNEVSNNALLLKSNSFCFTLDMIAYFISLFLKSEWDPKVTICHLILVK